MTDRLRNLITAVCREFGIDYAVLVNTRNRSRNVVDARLAFAYIAREDLGASYPEITESLGRHCRSHSSNMDRYKLALDRMADTGFARSVRDIRSPHIRDRELFEREGCREPEPTADEYLCGIGEEW